MTTQYILASNGRTILTPSLYGYRIVLVCRTKRIAAEIMRGLHV